MQAVFFESIENPKVVTGITKETGARVGGELYADGLGDETASTYTDMVRYNIATIGAFRVVCPGIPWGADLLWRCTEAVFRAIGRWRGDLDLFMSASWPMTQKQRFA